MIIRFVEFTIPFMVVELDYLDLGEYEKGHYVWLIEDFVEYE